MITVNIKKLILDFLIDWLQWAESENPAFYYAKGSGLCSNLNTFYYTRYRNSYNFKNDLAKLFLDDGLNASFPFGEAQYCLAKTNNNQHLDPVRLTWVKKTINTLQKELG